MEEEIYATNSPIWDPEFRQVPPAHVQAVCDAKAAAGRRVGEFEKLTAPPNDKNNYTTINVTPGVGKKGGKWVESVQLTLIIGCGGFLIKFLLNTDKKVRKNQEKRLADRKKEEDKRNTLRMFPNLQLPKLSRQ